ncbi:MAG: 23S rRNA (uracil(1939)-C(5))-methyltransferase RlmD [Acidimicrobiia bacterium]|nr:23S rRNA (uracil(1939)-C(5))-methyltransferase RlmD [Acidimicrobiia bacterium]
MGGGAAPADEIIARICRHERDCGGCGLQHLPYVEQIQRKARALLDRLPRDVRPAGAPASLFVPVFPPTRDGPWHFRQKVAFVFGTMGRDLVMGHYASGSQRVVAVEECPVHSARGNRIAFALRDEMKRAHVGAVDSSAGVLRYLLVRTTEDDSEAIAMLVVSDNDRRLRKPIRALLASPNRPDGFYLNIHKDPGPYMVGEETIRIAGRSHVRERVGRVSYLVSPTAFFQTNVRAAGALQAMVLGWVGGAGARVLDLYAGSGLFSLPLAAAGAHVVGVEENRAAVKDAEANRRLNHVPTGRLRFLADRVEHALTRLTHERWDAIVLDPPRSGCTPAVIDKVFGRIAAPVVVYVSCNPDALAVELPVILAQGYVVDEVRAVDMFPHTEHIEAVLCLKRVARRGDVHDRKD